MVYGFRLAVRTDLGRRIVRAWSIVPAAVSERDIGTDLVCGDAAMIDALLLDNPVEASFKEITDQVELARHGAPCFEGLLTRTAATLAAHALRLTALPDQG